ncbi:MAG: hypothetical protein KDC53_01650 [Saprospiraceae bacterium]|nr:hypothetical protein [Saprospiraceae bacterium]
MKEHLQDWSSLWILPFLLACSVSKVQNGVTPDQDQINIRTAVTDQLGNLYFAKYSNEIIKQDPDGKQIGYFSNNQLGKIGIIDATSPLKVMVFYPDFNTGVVLDRRLLETGRFNLIDMGFGEIDLVAFSRDGTIWIFDDHEQRLYKIDQQGQIIRTGDDLRLTFNERLQPTRMIEAGEFLYLGIPGKGVLVFDLFGQYKSQVLFDDLLDFQVIQDGILIFEKADSLNEVNILTHTEKRFLIKDELRVGRILVTKQQLIHITQEAISHLPLDALNWE